MNRIILLAFLIGLLTLSGCSRISTSTAELSELRVLTHDSFAVSESVINQFEVENNAKVLILKSGDTGSLVNRAILTRANPEADVLYGIDNTYLSRGLDAGLFESYQSQLLIHIPPEFLLDPEQRAIPIDYGDVCINYDQQYFKDHQLAIPQDLVELSKAEYRNLLVVENPATSSPGLAFLLTTISRFGEEEYLNYWRDLRSNGVVVVNDWSTAYYTNFSASTGKGLQTMVVSYNTSPAAEVVYAENPITESPTASITSPYTCFRQIEFAGILKGTNQYLLASKFIDAMLSKAFQEDIPLQMFMLPVQPDIALPQVFIDTVIIPEKTASLSPKLIAENRERWIQEWTEVVLR